MKTLTTSSFSQVCSSRHRMWARSIGMLVFLCSTSTSALSASLSSALSASWFCLQARVHASADEPVGELGDRLACRGQVQKICTCGPTDDVLVVHQHRRLVRVPVQRACRLVLPVEKGKIHQPRRARRLVERRVSAGSAGNTGAQLAVGVLVLHPHLCLVCVPVQRPVCQLVLPTEQQLGMGKQGALLAEVEHAPGQLLRRVLQAAARQIIAERRAFLASVGLLCAL